MSLLIYRSHSGHSTWSALFWLAVTPVKQPHSSQIQEFLAARFFLGLSSATGGRIGKSSSVSLGAGRLYLQARALTCFAVVWWRREPQSVLCPTLTAVPRLLPEELDALLAGSQLVKLFLPLAPPRWSLALKLYRLALRHFKKDATSNVRWFQVPMRVSTDPSARSSYGFEPLLVRGWYRPPSVCSVQ